MNEANVISQVLPQDKHEIIKEIQFGKLTTITNDLAIVNSRDVKYVKLCMDDTADDEDSVKEDMIARNECMYKVGMVGDGINDTAALSEREAIITESMIIDDGVFGIHKIPRHKSYHTQLNNLTSISPTCPNTFNFDDTQIDFKNNYNIINDNQSKTISTNQKRYVQYGWLVSDVQLQILSYGYNI